MEKNTTKNRLAALDGLRGFAIILVFLNHINTSYLQSLLPRALFSWIFVNGVTGVTFLFILSGFLMSSIYPNPPSASGFLQKRYTRIFPLFLTMSAVMFMGRITATTSPLVLLLVLITCALFTHSVWVYIVKKLPRLFGRLLFFSFLLLQTCAGLFYVLWVARQAPIVFNHLLPPLVREGTIYLVNATLTLPLGQYIPMLDGVYWTLVAEVLFYVLYPTVILPIAKLLGGKSMKVKLLFLLCLIPLLGGIHMLSYKIFVLSYVQPALFFYFATGIFLGYLYRHYQTRFEVFSKRFFSGIYAPLPFILFFLACATINDLSFLGQVISPWVRMLYAIPFTFLVAILLDTKTAFSKFFSTKSLVFIGTISYSIYLSHSLVIHMAILFAGMGNGVSEIFYILIIFAINVVIASFLFFLLEKPYFSHTAEPLIAPVSKKAIAQAVRQKRNNGKYILVGISLIYLIGIFTAYQSQNSLNFFSYSVPVPQKDFLTPLVNKNSPVISMIGQSPITLNISASSDNFGLVLIKVHHTLKLQGIPQAMQFSLFEKGSQIPLIVSTYSLDNFNKNSEFPFGFPNIANAKGKDYTVQLTLTNPYSTDFATIDTTSIQTVYAANKSGLVKNPIKLVSFVNAKIQNIFQNQEALLVLVLLIPFAVMSGFLILFIS